MKSIIHEMFMQQKSTTLALVTRTVQEGLNVHQIVLFFDSPFIKRI